MVNIIKLFVFFGVFGFFLSLTNCSHTQVDPDDPEAVFKEAEEAFKDERYLIAIEKYRDIKNRFPYNARAIDSELRIADSFFAQESYLEAESAYEVFKELHPTHPKSDYVQFRIGLSFFNQIPSNAARDLSAAHRAIDAFEELIKKFSSSKHVKKAEELMRQSKAKLAEYENYVADFYFQRKHYLSASYRYATLLQDFSQLGYNEIALYRLGESYFHIQMFANAADTLQRLLKSFPETEYKQRTISLLKSIEKKQRTN